MINSAALKTNRPQGELRRALVDAGLDLLARDGLAGLTLRACAAQAGVSHAAPAHHFAGLPGLLTAISAQGFAMFTQSMLNARAVAEPNAYAALVGVCHGYLQFSKTHSALFTLMFNHPFTRTDDADFTANSDQAYRVLEQACAPFEPVSGSQVSTEMMIWSLVHGLACLQQSGRTGPVNVGLPEIDIADILPKLTLKSPVVEPT